MSIRSKFEATIDAIATEALRERGHANVFLAGRAGVGKSTLVNAVFDGNLARVGQGRPVTRHTRVYSRAGIPLSLYDNRGLEMVDFHAIMAEQERHVREVNHDPDANNHIHVGWICIAEDLRRVEDAEIEMARMLARHVPVIAVITKARSDQGFRATVQRLLPEARAVVRVRALPERLDDGHVMPQQGLHDLVAATCEIFPEGQRRAFVAAQKIDLELKRQNARWIVARHALYAAGNAAMPLPIADQMGLAGIYVSMFAGISAAYGLSPTAQTLSAFMAAAVGTPATMMTTGLLLSSLLKMVPGVGTIAGQVLGAAVAPAVISTIGLAYIELLHGLYTLHDGGTPDDGEIVEALREDFESLVEQQEAGLSQRGEARAAPARGARRAGAGAAGTRKKTHRKSKRRPAARKPAKKAAARSGPRRLRARVA